MIIIMVDTIYFASNWNSFKFLLTFGIVHHVFLQHLDVYLNHITLFPTQILGALEEKPLFTTGVYDCFLVERDILQLIV